MRIPPRQIIPYRVQPIARSSAAQLKSGPISSARRQVILESVLPRPVVFHQYAFCPPQIDAVVVVAPNAVAAHDVASGQAIYPDPITTAGPEHTVVMGIVVEYQVIASSLQIYPGTASLNAGV